MTQQVKAINRQSKRGGKLTLTLKKPSGTNSVPSAPTTFSIQGGGGGQEFQVSHDIQQDIFGHNKGVGRHLARCNNLLLRALKYLNVFNLGQLRG